jgi:hypothetical protein
MNSIKEHYLYPLYVEYLKNKRISLGAFEILKISEKNFYDFKYRYDSEDGFRDKMDRFYKSILRENKINDILK